MRRAGVLREEIEGRVLLGHVDGRMLREELKVQSLAEVPAWAEAALSRYSLLMQPSTPEQLTAFLRYAGELHRQYMKASCGIRGMPDWRERR